MTLFIYLKSKCPIVLGWLGFLFLTALILWLTPSVNFNLGAFLYLTLLEFIILMLALVFTYYSKQSWWNKLEQTDFESTMSDFLTGAQTLEQRLSQKAINNLIQEQRNQTEKLIEQQQEQKEFIDSWVHEIKVPLAGLQLLSESIEADISEKKLDQMEDELHKINQFIDQVLYFSRLDSFSKDYLIHEYSLKKIVQKNVQKSASYFIQKHIKFTLEDQDYDILTDPKWLDFIINQILSNALKYTPDYGKITVSMRKMEQGVFLTIDDNGIGIPLEDQRRIFDKGFTGENGRHSDQHSTGLGLYLAKSLAEKLGHQLFVESEVGKGTSIHILFPFLSYYDQTDEEAIL